MRPSANFKPSGTNCAEKSVVTLMTIPAELPGIVDGTATRRTPMDDNTDIVEYLRRNAVFNYRDTYIAAADEIERLRKERDEARQIACNREAELNRMMFDNPKYSDSVAIAAQRGWDCFKEKTND
jgi:hypothetical protein